MFRDPPAVKDLIQTCTSLATFYSIVLEGGVNESEYAKHVNDPGSVHQLRLQFRAAANEVGESKALRKAVGMARATLEGRLYVGPGGINVTRAANQLELDLRGMLGR